MLQVTKNYSGPVGYSGPPSVPHSCCALLVRNLGFSAITHCPSCSFYNLECSKSQSAIDFYMGPCISIKCAWICTFPANFFKNQGRLRSEINVALRYVYKAAQCHVIQTGHAKFISGD